MLRSADWKHLSFEESLSTGIRIVDLNNQYRADKYFFETLPEEKKKKLPDSVKERFRLYPTPGSQG